MKDGGRHRAKSRPQRGQSDSRPPGCVYISTKSAREGKRERAAGENGKLRGCPYIRRRSNYWTTAGERRAGEQWYTTLSPAVYIELDMPSRRRSYTRAILVQLAGLLSQTGAIMAAKEEEFLVRANAVLAVDTKYLIARLFHPLIVPLPARVYYTVHLSCRVQTRAEKFFRVLMLIVKSEKWVVERFRYITQYGFRGYIIVAAPRLSYTSVWRTAGNFFPLMY